MKTVVRQMSTDESNIKNQRMKNTMNALKPAAFDVYYTILLENCHPLLFLQL